MTSGQPPAVRMRFQLAAFTLTRTVFNTSYRRISPSLPVFARGLGVDLSTMALAVAARSSIGLASPFLGSIADHRGRKRTMLAPLGVFVVGMTLVAYRPVFSVLVVGLGLGTIAQGRFAPAAAAHPGQRAP